MNRKKLFVLTLAILLAIQIPTGLAADAAILQVSTDNIYLTAGQENTVKINLRNTGDYNLFDAECFLTSTETGLSILTGVHMVFNTIDKGKTATYEPTIYVAQDVELGAYSLSLTVIYRRFGAAQDSTVTVPIGLVVDEGYVPKVKYSTGQGSVRAKSGAENQLTYMFTNNWDETLYDLEFTLSSASGYISVVDGLSTRLEELEVGKSVAVVPVLSILEGTPLAVYTLTATVSYRDSEDSRYYQSFSLPVNVDSAAAAKATVVTLKRMEVLQERVRPGDAFDVQLEVQCSGADAYELLSKLSFGTVTSISPLSPTTSSLGDLEVGGTAVTTYRLLASGDIAAGQYPVTATVTYTTSRGVSGSLTETLTVMVEGLIEFDLIDTPTETVGRGESRELEADLLLIGTESVDFVSIGLVEDDVFQRVAGSTEYIGAVDPDSPIPFDINYRVAEDAEEGDHELSLSIEYRDHLNREHEEQLGFTVNVGGNAPQPGQDAAPSGLWVWIRRLLGLGP
jgi:hypothetical protein